MLVHDKWYWQFNNLHKTIDLDRSILAQYIEEHCHLGMENKNKDKQGKTTYYLHMDTLKLAVFFYLVQIFIAQSRAFSVWIIFHLQ